jgi:hypothetical protein
VALHIDSHKKSWFDPDCRLYSLLNRPKSFLQRNQPTPCPTPNQCSRFSRSSKSEYNYRFKGLNYGLSDSHGRRRRQIFHFSSKVYLVSGGQSSEFLLCIYRVSGKLLFTRQQQCLPFSPTMYLNPQNQANSDIFLWKISLLDDKKFVVHIGERSVSMVAQRVTSWRRWRGSLTLKFFSKRSSPLDITTKERKKKKRLPPL